MNRYKKKNRQITRHKKTKIDGIQFQSKLESHMYLLLKAHKIKAGYESHKFTIIDGFELPFSSYEKTPYLKVRQHQMKEFKTLRLD